jgi:signal transduction histidine kinase
MAKDWRPRPLHLELHCKADADLITHLQGEMEHDHSRVAKLLHDELGALMVAAIMDIACVEAHLGAADTDCREKLARAREGLRSAIAIKRKLIDELRPTLLDEVGLFAALSWHLKKTWGRAGVAPTGLYPAAELHLEPDVLIGIFRIAEDALVMSLKHRAVKSASLTVTIDHDRLLMRFIDDGVAPRAGSLRQGSDNVLTSMKNRLRMLGGKVSITRRPGGSTMILASVPIAHPLVA